MATLSTRWLLSLVIGIAAIMFATVVLGYYSYNAASQVATRSEQTLEKSNRDVGRQLIDRIEKVIIDSDRTLFRMVRLEDPGEFIELWRRIVRISPVVQTVIVLDEDMDVVHLVSNMPRAHLGQFRKVFLQQIVRVMDLPSLPPDAHRHLHRSYGGKPYLVSFTRRRSGDREYFIALNMNLPYITREIFREEFRPLEQSKFIAVLDENHKWVYGRSAPRAAGTEGKAREAKNSAEKKMFLYEERFPTTLYRWRLQISPRGVGTLRSEARRRRTLNIVLVATADGLILLGMITLLVAVRKERRANQLKSDFISNVTHELKTPLSLIRMFGELLPLGRTSSKQTSREYAEIITRESDRLSRLIDNVLDFARMERGKAAYEFSMGDISTVVERGVDLVRYRAEKAGVKLETEIAEELPDTLMDENALTLALLNLLENAMKYGVDEQGEIHVGLHREGSDLVLAVSDRGDGIPTDEVGRIFDRFFRGRTARSRSMRGSGIGLSLVKHIVAAHRGRVQVESKPGQGTRFELIFPVIKES